MSAVLKPEFVFDRERYSEALCEELTPLLQDNWVRTESYIGELAIDPAWEKYKTLDKLDLVKCVTARHDGVLVGYCIFFTNFSLHHRTVKCGHGDMIYVKDAPGHGRIVFGLLDIAEALLRAENVYAMGWFVHKGSKIHKILARRGYREDELVMEKKLCAL